MRKNLLTLIAILFSLSVFSQDNDRNNIIKVKLSLLSYEIGYERGFLFDDEPYSYEIGLGTYNNYFFDYEDTPQLYTLRLGIKKFLGDDVEMFDGLFIKNEVFGQYAYKFYDWGNRNLQDYYTFANNFSVGFQYFFFNRISYEMNIGIGIAYSNFTDTAGDMLDVDFGVGNLNGVRLGLMKRSDTRLSTCLVGAIKIGYNF